MGSCFNCFTSLASVFKWFEFTVLRWITSTWATCSAAPCDWWCLCCNKWLCWIVMIIIAIVSVIIWLIVEIILIVFCLIIAIWCILVYIICYVGCLGMKGCVDNCINNAPTATSVEITWDYPITDSGSNKGGLTDPGGPGTGTGTGTGRGTRPNPFARQPRARITRVGQLEELVQWKRLFIWLTPVQIELPNVSREQSDRAQSTIDRYVAACGCHEGQLGALLATLVFVLFLLVRTGEGQTIGWAELRSGFGVLLIGALVGKTFGVLRARLLLRKSVQLFARTLQPG